MKKRFFAVIISLILFTFSCDEPETTVLNIVHADGSITRTIEMRNSKNIFKKSDLQVPYDSTWKLKDSIAVGAKGDTTWIKKAVKLFRNAEEINATYRSDSGPNREFKRNAVFSRHFRWFNTTYRFSENFDRILDFGYPLSEILSGSENEWFHSPESLIAKKINGPDSLRYRAFSDSVKNKTDLWTAKIIVSGWINEFSGQIKGKDTGGLERTLKGRENELVRIMERYTDKFDSLWDAGVILSEMIGKDNAVKFKTEADSAKSVVIRKVMVPFRDYSEKIVMPGKLTGTNGFADSSKVILWPVKSDFFMTQKYEMWAESTTRNIWAWIVSAIFVLFVITGLVIKRTKKG